MSITANQKGNASNKTPRSAQRNAILKVKLELLSDWDRQSLLSHRRYKVLQGLLTSLACRLKRGVSHIAPHFFIQSFSPSVFYQSALAGISNQKGTFLVASVKISLPKFWATSLECEKRIKKWCEERGRMWPRMWEVKGKEECSLRRERVGM